MKTKIKRIGRCWIDKALLSEGYGPEDFDEEDPIELPELFDPVKKENVGWLWCPQCHEKSQVVIHEPICKHCGWTEESLSHPEEVSCSA